MRKLDGQHHARRRNGSAAAPLDLVVLGAAVTILPKWGRWGRTRLANDAITSIPIWVVQFIDALLLVWIVEMFTRQVLLSVEPLGILAQGTAADMYPVPPSCCQGKPEPRPKVVAL